MQKIKICFIWQGINGRYGQWKDGLWKAMKNLEEKYEVIYCEPTDDIPEDSVVFYWESPVTILGKDSANYKRIKNLPNKKALLFAGGRIEKEWLDGFDHVFYESKINGDELRNLGVSCSLAFGINEEIMQPKRIRKYYLGMHHGTCASWKRQWLVGQALKEKGLVVGRRQETDSYPFDECTKQGCIVMDEKTPEEISDLLNQSYVCLQTSDYWGGGQRCTLEALACNVPVICMSDSPKNREYVEESGVGEVCEPNVESIIDSMTRVMATNYGNKGREYIMKHWTSKHYSDNLKKWLKSA